MRRVSIRELWRNSSAVIRRKAGGSLEVTKRGQPVARSVPIPEPNDLVERLVAEAEATLSDGTLADVPPPLAPPPGRPLPSTILIEMRRDER